MKEKIWKRIYRAFLSDKTAESWCIYQDEKKAAKKVVAVSKAAQGDDVNEKLETRNGDHHLYRLA